MLLVFVLGNDGALVPASGAARENDAGLGDASGTLSHVLCNGTLCVRSMSLRDAGPGDGLGPNVAGERALVFRAIVSNEAHSENRGYFDVTLADAGGATCTGRPLDAGWSLAPGEVGRAANIFFVPLEFVPAALILGEAARPSAPPFRITIRPHDVRASFRRT